MKINHDNILYLDFEYNETNKKFVNLLCAGVRYKGEISSRDLTTEGGIIGFKKFMHNLPPVVICSYNITAECRALLSLFRCERLPTKFKNFICLHREHRLLANKHYKTAAGLGVVKDKKTGKFEIKDIKFGEYTAKGFKPHTNLVNALYKFLGDYNPTHLELKEKMLDVIIRRPHLIPNHFQRIMDYAMLDTDKLPDLFDAMVEEYEERLNPEHLTNLKKEMLFRGYQGYIMACKEVQGTHLNMEALVNLVDNKNEIINKVSDYITNKWPDIKTFTENPKTGLATFHASAVRDEINKMPEIFKRQFPRSKKTQKISVGQEVFEKFYPKYDHHPDDYLQQIFRYLRTRSAMSSLNFKPAGPGKAPTLHSYYDPEHGVLRPYYNDYGSQTGRYQPKSNGYLLLQPAWMRTLVTPPPDGHKGRNWAILYGDYGKQEILILAVLSQDEALIEAYASGDPYVWFGKSCGGITAEKGTPEFKVQRESFKQATLAIFYGMEAPSLAAKLTAVLKRFVSIQEATTKIFLFGKTFKKAKRYMDQQESIYLRQKYLRLPHGWTMWGDNFNKRSIRNFPIQGHGGVCLSYCDRFMFDRGRNAPFLLHDALMQYVALDDNDCVPKEEIDLFRNSMLWAFAQSLGNAPGSDLITLDIKAISPRVKNVDIVTEAEYIDERGINQLKEFKQFFTKEEKCTTNNQTNSRTPAHTNNMLEILFRDFNPAVEAKRDSMLKGLTEA